MRWARRSVLLVVLPAALWFPALLIVGSGGSASHDPVAWAQASSCGNAILEPGEDCDPPGSVSCPPGSPSGAVLACNADCTCPAAPVGLDHFQCYGVKRRAFSPVPVTVEDQFGTLEQSVRRPGRLCVPSDKDGEGIIDPTDHLVSYEADTPRTARFTPRRNQTVVNQFGTLQLDVLRPSSMLVPSGKDGVAQTPPLDHFECYVIKRAKGGAKFVAQTVTVSNQFDDDVTVTLVRPFRLCAPASKNDEDPTAPQHPDHLLCYRTRSERFGDAEHTIQNQFGGRNVRVISRNEFCVPSQKNPGTTTSTTATSTTTSSTATTSTTTTSSTTIPTVPTTTTTSSTTTTTGPYGSPSRAFLAPRGSLLD